MHFGADEAVGVTDVDAGAIIDHIEIEDQEGDLVADTEHGPGWEVGAGVAIGVGEKGSLTPGVRFRSLSRDLEFDGGEVPVDLRYVTAELGFAWRI